MAEKNRFRYVCLKNYMLILPPGQKMISDPSMDRLNICLPNVYATGKRKAGATMRKTRYKSKMIKGIRPEGE